MCFWAFWGKIVQFYLLGYSKLPQAIKCGQLEWPWSAGIATCWSDATVTQMICWMLLPLGQTLCRKHSVQSNLLPNCVILNFWKIFGLIHFLSWQNSMSLLKLPISNSIGDNVSTTLHQSQLLCIPMHPVRHITDLVFFWDRYDNLKFEKPCVTPLSRTEYSMINFRSIKMFAGMDDRLK